DGRVHIHGGSDGGGHHVGVGGGGEDQRRGRGGGVRGGVHGRVGGERERDRVSGHVRRRGDAVGAFAAWQRGGRPRSAGRDVHGRGDGVAGLERPGAGSGGQRTVGAAGPARGAAAE